jgi:hypothetical protein
VGTLPPVPIIVRELTDRDALLGAWCVKCGRAFRAGQRVVLDDGQAASHEDCNAAS